MAEPVPVCDYVRNGLREFCFVVMTGDLLSGITVPGFPDSCKEPCGDNIGGLLYNYIQKIECDRLTSSRTDSGYVEHCVTISPAAWSITL
jgi:hypothetical protein